MIVKLSVKIAKIIGSQGSDNALTMKNKEDKDKLLHQCILHFKMNDGKYKEFRSNPGLQESDVITFLKKHDRMAIRKVAFEFCQLQNKFFYAAADGYDIIEKGIWAKPKELQHFAKYFMSVLQVREDELDDSYELLSTPYNTRGSTLYQTKVSSRIELEVQKNGLSKNSFAHKRSDNENSVPLLSNPSSEQDYESCNVNRSYASPSSYSDHQLLTENKKSDRACREKLNKASLLAALDKLLQKRKTVRVNKVETTEPLPQVRISQNQKNQETVIIIPNYIPAISGQVQSTNMLNNFYGANKCEQLLRKIDMNSFDKDVLIGGFQYIDTKCGNIHLDHNLLLYYRFICNKRACFYVSISALVVCLFSTICMFFGVYTVNLWLDVFLIVANTVVAIIMMFGLYYDKAALLVPFIVSEITQCVCFFILANYVLYYTIVFRRQKFYQKFDQMLMVISIYLGIIICIGAIWAATKCYHYLRQKAEGIYPDTGERCIFYGSIQVHFRFFRSEIGIPSEVGIPTELGTRI
uniref:Uncharacterized protein n=2 Tax=Caenorhabditis japonica TaxID=281687 RepID=A0A8R1E063_CAEJA